MQHDDPAHASEGSASPKPAIDINKVQDEIQKLAEKSGKIKGINKSRIDADILEDDIANLLASVHLIMSREASVELLKFIKFKVTTGQLNKNYHRIFKQLLGEASLSHLLEGKMNDDERFDILSIYVNRLIQNRPLTFYGVDDTALYRDGKSNTDNNDFVTMANNPSLLVDYISYSEMEFSRRIAISGLSHLYKFTGTGYNKISTLPVFIHSHAGIRLERVETPEYKKLFISETRNADLFKSIKAPGLLVAFKKPGVGSILKTGTPNLEVMLVQEKPKLYLNITLYKSMIKEIIENYFADCNRIGAQTQKHVLIRLMPIDMMDSNYSIAELTDNGKTVTPALISAQCEVLESIIDHPDFKGKYPAISAIELRKSYWEQSDKGIKQPFVRYKNFADDDMLAELADPITESATNEPTDTLLCINMVCGANAYAGNRIYKNSLSSIDAEIANRSNITTLFNPLFNPVLSRTALLDHLLIRFPSGKLSSLVGIKDALAQAAKTAPQAAVEEPIQQAQAAPESTVTTESKPVTSKFTFPLPGNLLSTLKLFFAKLGSFFKLIAEIFHHIKSALIEMINSKRKP